MSAPATERPLVAHLVRTYLWPSETFIQGQIVGGERWRSIVVARHAADPQPFDLGPRKLVLTNEGGAALSRRWADWSYGVRRLTTGEAVRTARALADENVGLLHAHFGTDARFFRPLYRRVRAPLVVSFYGYDARKAPARFFGLGARYLAPVLSESARILVPSRDMADDVAALGASAARIDVLPWGIDTQRFRPRHPRTPVDGRVRFATGCRFTEKKGVHVLIEAFARALAAGVEAELVVAGSGPLALQYERQVARLRIEDRVRFPGFVAAAELPQFFADIDVFVLASLTAKDGDKEGTPTVLMEAQSMGRPVVATRHGGIPDVVSDGVGGYLVPEGDVDALAERLIHLARARDEWPRLGARGREHVVAHFDARTQDRRREELYDRVVAA